MKKDLKCPLIMAQDFQALTPSTLRTLTLSLLTAPLSSWSMFAWACLQCQVAGKTAAATVFGNPVELVAHEQVAHSTYGD